jgi:hypothetical protein
MLMTVSWGWQPQQQDKFHAADFGTRCASAARFGCIVAFACFCSVPVTECGYSSLYAIHLQQILACTYDAFAER